MDVVIMDYIVVENELFWLNYNELQCIYGEL
jgi:hypothetical protein